MGENPTPALPPVVSARPMASPTEPAFKSLALINGKLYTITVSLTSEDGQTNLVPSNDNLRKPIAERLTEVFKHYHPQGHGNSTITHTVSLEPDPSRENAMYTTLNHEIDNLNQLNGPQRLEAQTHLCSIAELIHANLLRSITQSQGTASSNDDDENPAPAITDSRRAAAAATASSQTPFIPKPSDADQGRRAATILPAVTATLPSQPPQPRAIAADDEPATETWEDWGKRKVEEALAFLSSQKAEEEKHEVTLLQSEQERIERDYRIARELIEARDGVRPPWKKFRDWFRYRFSKMPEQTAELVEFSAGEGPGQVL